MPIRNNALYRCQYKRHKGTYSLSACSIFHKGQAFTGKITNIHLIDAESQSVLIGIWRYNNKNYRVKRFGKAAWTTIAHVTLINELQEADKELYNGKNT